MSAPVWEDPRVVAGMPAQVAARAAALAAGERHRGFKIGFGAPAALANLGTTGPLVGYLLASREVADGDEVDLAGWTKPALEPEVAVHLAADLPAGADRATATAAIAGFGVAIELADIDLPLTDPGPIVAADIFQRAYLLGPVAAAPGELDLARLGAVVTADGEEVARVADVTANVGDAIDLARHAADYLGAFGVALEAGSVLITGSVTPIVFPERGRTYGVRIDGLGELAVRLA